jgi:type VI secretion system protein ImpE
MTDQTAADLLRAGKLSEAVTAAQNLVRKSPADLDARILLAELLVLSGNPERADVLLDAASTIDPSTSVVVAEFRQLIRADMARRQLFRDGRVPELLSDATEVQRLQLQALVALRANDLVEAAKSAAAAEEARPRVSGFHNDVPFDDLRDADDLLAGNFEVLTTTGKYFWIPTERIETAEFHPPKRVRDLIWRRVSMSVSEGPDGDVYVPAIYAGSDATSDLLRLGRETEWTDEGAGPVRGIGQRVLLCGEDDIAIMDVGKLRFRA